MGSSTSSQYSSGNGKLNSIDGRIFLWEINTIIKVPTAGMVKIGSGGISVSSPTTGIVSHFKEMIQLGKELMKGVWLGKQALNATTITQNSKIRVGFQINIESYVNLESGFNKSNLSICHEAVLINGKVYSYEAEKGQGKKSAKFQRVYDTNYDWEYKGKCMKSNQEIEDWIKEFNNNTEGYHLLTHNCQHSSDQLIKFAIKK